MSKESVTEHIDERIANILESYNKGECYPSTDVDLYTMTKALKVAIKSLRICANSIGDAVQPEAESAMNIIEDILNK